MPQCNRILCFWKVGNPIFPGGAPKAMIAFNAILLGVEIDIAAKRSQNDIPAWFGIAARTQLTHSKGSPKLFQKLIGLKLGNVYCLRPEIKVNTLLVAIFATETLAKLFALGCGGFWRGDASWRPKPRAVEVVSVSFWIVRGQVKLCQLVGYESTCWLWYLIPRKVFSRKWCRIDLCVFSNPTVGCFGNEIKAPWSFENSQSSTCWRS